MAKFTNQHQWECGHCGKHSDIRETFVKETGFTVRTGYWYRELHECETCKLKQHVVVEFRPNSTVDRES